MEQRSNAEEHLPNAEDSARQEAGQERSLTASAKSAVLWAGGADLLRDVAQFGAALALVRLISKEEYGAFAVAQAIVGLLAYFGVEIWSEQARQERDPRSVDWSTHLTFGLGVNLVLFILVELAALVLADTAKFGQAAMPLAVTGSLLLTSVPGTLAKRRLEVEHRWKELRSLAVVGTYASLCVQMAVAWSGRGALALALGPVLSTLPEATYFFFGSKLRPLIGLNSTNLRKILLFGRYRIGAASSVRISTLAREFSITSGLGLGTVGLVNRALGLGNLTVNKFVSSSMASIYPVLTRLPVASAKMRRASALLLISALWFLIPTAVFVVVLGEEIVLLAFGQKWVEVIPFLPAAVAIVSLVTIGGVISKIVLANDRVETVFRIELLQGAGQAAAAVIVVPYGALSFLWASVAWHLVCVGVFMSASLKQRSITLLDLRAGFFGPVIGAAAAGLIVAIISSSVTTDSPASRVAAILGCGLTFGLIYGICLRILCSDELSSLLDVVPFGDRLRPWLRY
ncbi:oligosaccharide flippase family protein [bacterium]|nr:oligosaccharide flippase family protein [bacterium]